MIQVKGHLSYELVSRAGVILASGSQSNLITDAGLQMLAGTTWRNMGQYMAVGTGNTPPAYSDVALNAPVGGRVPSSQQMMTRPSNGVYKLPFSAVVSDGPGTAANFTEWGFSPPNTGPLWCRELFKDGGGVPVVVTKDDSQQLRLNYTITVSFNPDWQPMSFFVDGMGDDGKGRLITGEYRVLGGPVGYDLDMGYYSSVMGNMNSAPFFGLGSDIAHTTQYDATLGKFPFVYGGIGAAVTGGGVLAANSLSRSGLTLAFQPGNAATLYGLARVNNPYGDNSTQVDYVCRFDTPIVKSADQRLTLTGPSVSWGRG